MKKNIVTEGFEAFRRGSFENGGQNLYVSKKGVLQRIFQYDLNRNGYVDLVYANCQNHHESAPSYAYELGGERADLPGQGSLCGMVLDIDGDGYNDIVVAGKYDMAAPYASTDIYFGSDEGYSEKYHIRIPTPQTTDCAYGDIIGCGKPQLVFAMPIYKKVRIFTQTDLGLEWGGFVDYEIEAELVTVADLDGDGYDDVIVKMVNSTDVTVYWGSADGIDVERKTTFTYCDPKEVVKPFSKESKQSEMEKIFPASYLVEALKWNGKNCIFVSNGTKIMFFASSSEREFYKELEIEAPFALSCAVGDIDGDGFDDIALACRDWADGKSDLQNSYIIWNGPDGLDKKPRTVLKTLQACHVVVDNGSIAFGASSNEPSYQNDIRLFENGNFDEPKLFEGQDTRRVALFANPDGKRYLFVQNHYSRSFIGFDETYIYYGDKDGYDPERREAVPSHCAVDALIADLDDDGYAELLVGNNSENSIHLDVGHHIHHFSENGFDPAKSRTIQTDVGWGVCAGDVDHDGYLEIITPCKSWKSVRVFRGCDDYNTWYDIEMPEGTSARWPALADINGDGWLDLVVPGGMGGAKILWGGPDGFSMERSKILNTPMSINVTFADLTKNGYPDVIIGTHTETPRNGRLTDINPHHSFVNIYWNGPSGLSESRKCTLRADAGDSFAVADFNNDGWLDIFVGNYHGGKDRDVNSFIYWNREGSFRELDRELLFTHSASGCLAADFNEDGYIDLAVANHKVDGDHKGYSTVWWNGPEGFNPKKQTDLPTCGPHGMISTNLGNIMNRSGNEHYTSEVFDITENCTLTAVKVEADVPAKTSVTATVRVNGGEWVAPEGVALKAGDKLEYRLCLYAYNCLRTPRVTKVTVELDA